MSDSWDNIQALVFVMLQGMLKPIDILVMPHASPGLAEHSKFELMKSEYFVNLN